MTLKVDYRLFVFPPWYVYHIFTKLEDKTLNFRELYFTIWITLQWFLIFISTKNIFINTINAHLAIMGFLMGNLYLQLEVEEYSSEDQKFLRSTPIKAIVSLGVLAFMYLFANLPKIVLGGFEDYLDVNIISKSIIWGSFHSFVGYLLIILWLIYVVLDKFEIFKLFPRTSGKIYADKLGNFGKAVILLLYLVAFLFVYDLVKGDHLIYFSG